MKIRRYDVWSLDVWGGEDEGFTVNDRSCIRRGLEFPTYPQGYNRGMDRELLRLPILRLMEKMGLAYT